MYDHVLSLLVLFHTLITAKEDGGRWGGLHKFTAKCCWEIRKSFVDAPKIIFAEFIFKALELYLTCSNSILITGISYGPMMQHKGHYVLLIQRNAMFRFAVGAWQSHVQPTLWKRFWDDILTDWTKSFLVYLNQTDSTGHIEFTMHEPDDDGLKMMMMIFNSCFC